MPRNTKRVLLVAGVLLIITSVIALVIGWRGTNSEQAYTPPPSVAVVTPSSSASPSTTTSTPPKSNKSAQSSTSAAPVRACRAGVPTRFFWDQMGINNVPVDRVGTADDGSPGVPDNKHNIGWYAESAKPGAGTGTSFVTGHTYNDDSAVFKENFTGTLKPGSKYAMQMDNGSLCWYEVTAVYPYLNKQTEYPKVAEAHDFLRPDGPERSVGCTCSGYFDTSIRSHDDSTCWEAKPIN